MSRHPVRMIQLHGSLMVLLGQKIKNIYMHVFLVSSQSLSFHCKFSYSIYKKTLEPTNFF